MCDASILRCRRSLCDTVLCYQLASPVHEDRRVCVRQLTRIAREPDSRRRAATVPARGKWPDCDVELVHRTTSIGRSVVSMPMKGERERERRVAKSRERRTFSSIESE